MQRLFTAFTRGLPGTGLFILRLVTGTRLVFEAITVLGSGLQADGSVLKLLAAIGGLLLLAGSWTTAAGTLVAVIELWIAFFQPGDPWAHITLASISAALTLTGPGAWSVDARRFGLRRVNIPESKG